eukprot:214035-Amphidinium_carterae.1
MPYIIKATSEIKVTFKCEPKTHTQRNFIFETPPSKLRSGVLESFQPQGVLVSGSALLSGSDYEKYVNVLKSSQFGTSCNLFPFMSISSPPLAAACLGRMVIKQSL